MSWGMVRVAVGPPGGCTGDTVFGTVDQGVHLSAHAEGSAGGWSYSNWELLLLNSAAGAIPGNLCWRRCVGFAF